jgi:dihydrolipoamide dehydrogenase
MRVGGGAAAPLPGQAGGAHPRRRRQHRLERAPCLGGLSREALRCVPGVRPRGHNGVPVLATSARFVGPGHIEAGDRCFEGGTVVIATGAASVAADLPGEPARPPLTNDGVMTLDHAPSDVVILGGGRFSIEWADFLQAMGSAVTVVSDADRILPGEDADLAGFLQLVLEERGVRFALGTAVEAVNGDKVITSSGTFAADGVVCADTRRPNTSHLGLDTTGVAVSDDGAIVVDEHQRTTREPILAAGDVTGPPWLTNRAVVEGIAAARTARGDATAVNHNRIPRAVNTDPPLAAVGLTLEQARDAGRTAGLRMYDLSLSPRAIAIGDPRGALKLVVDEDSGEVLGGHMVGHDATEVIAQVVLAMDAEVGYQQLGTTFGVHPSMSEAIAQAIRFGPV